MKTTTIAALALGLAFAVACFAGLSLAMKPTEKAYPAAKVAPTKPIAYADVYRVGK